MTNEHTLVPENHVDEELLSEHFEDEEMETLADYHRMASLHYAQAAKHRNQQTGDQHRKKRDGMQHKRICQGAVRRHLEKPQTHHAEIMIRPDISG